MRREEWNAYREHAKELVNEAKSLPWWRFMSKCLILRELEETMEYVWKGLREFYPEVFTS